MTRAAGYVRVSTERQAEEGLSLAEQERRVREYAERQGWDLIDVYVERGVSGRRDDRPELGRLLAILANLDRVIIPKLDRLGRSNRHLLEVCDRLEASGVGLISLAENIDTATPTGRLLRAILAALAEFEADTIAERVRAVTESRARSGRPNGGPAPYGYAYGPEKSGLVVVRDEALIVARIFAEWCNGRTRRPSLAA
jgi:site-specific DNA recombinase